MTSRKLLPLCLGPIIPEQPCVGRLNDPTGGYICMRIVLNLCSLQETAEPTELFDKHRIILGLDFTMAPRALCNCLKIKHVNTLYPARHGVQAQWREVPCVWIDRKVKRNASPGFASNITDAEHELNNLLTEIINMELLQSVYNLSERDLNFEARSIAKKYRGWLSRSTVYNGNPQYLYPVKIYRMGFGSWRAGDFALPDRIPESIPDDTEVGGPRLEAVKNFFRRM